MNTILDLPFAMPVLGGLLIGSAAALYLVVAGRIMGVSGLLAGATGLGPSDSRLRPMLFLVGLLGGALLATRWTGMPDITVTGASPLLIAGGLLVGYGTRLGSGCTSGHGVCGMARLSPRSLVATAVFMGVAAATVFVVRHVIGGAA